MKSCLRPSRLFLPRGGFEKWATPAWDRYPHDHMFWKRVARTVGDAPSTFAFFPDEAMDADDYIEASEEVSDRMYSYLEAEILEHVGRAFILTERKLKEGVRYGIVAAVDLETYSFRDGEDAPVRATIPPTAKALELCCLRAGSPLEFPYTTLFYHDKKDKIVKELLSAELDLMYNFKLMEDGGDIKGYYIPEDFACDIAGDFLSRGFGLAVADGHDCIAAAKLYWEQVKVLRRGKRALKHPARYFLAELVNICSPAVTLLPVVRTVMTEDEGAFRDFFLRNMKCREQGGDLVPLQSDFGAIAKADEIIAKFVKANGGEVSYQAAPKEGGVNVLFESIDKEDFYPAIKGGKLLPANAYLFPEEAKRYCLEGREISYD